MLAYYKSINLSYLLSVADDELQQFYASFAAAVELFPAATVHQDVDVRSSDDSERVFLQVPGGSAPQLAPGVYRMKPCSAAVFNVVKHLNIIATTIKLCST